MCGQVASATQMRPSSSHHTTIRSPIHVFLISFAFSIVLRLATKNQPSGKGESKGRRSSRPDVMGTAIPWDAASPASKALRQAGRQHGSTGNRLRAFLVPAGRA